MTLDESLNYAYKQLNVRHVDQTLFSNYLSLMELKDSATAEHMKRVGLKTAEVFKFFNLGEKTGLYVGLMHDIGKIVIDPELLAKKGNFTIEDHNKIKAHVIAGYKMLAGRNDFTADVIVRHHSFSPDPYPENIPEFRKEYSVETKATINQMARLLSLVDFYDALTTRNNEAYKGNKKEVLLKHNKDAADSIEKLCAANIFVL